MTKLYYSFRYPCDDETLLDADWAGDFLRCKDDFPDRVDARYLVNQRDSANFFIDWLMNVNQHGFEEMLAEQHRLAALGRDRQTPYDIFVDDDFVLTVESVQNDVIKYQCQKNDVFRETYPGLFRWELEIRGIDHTTLDYSDGLSHEVAKLLESCVNSTATLVNDPRFANFDYDSALSKKNVFNVTFRDCAIQCPVYFDGERLYRYAPRGNDWSVLLQRSILLMNEIRSEINAETMPKANLVAEYYHVAINLMPFSNINNSIFLGQVNAIRRICGMPGISHGDLDWAAFLSSWDAFAEIFASLNTQNM